MAKGNSKPQVYQGKTYPSIAALAKELNISALYLGLGIKKYPDDIEKAIEHCKEKMNGTGNTRNKKVVYKGVEYKSYSELARNLLHMGSVDKFNAKRYELMKNGRSEEEALTEAIEYFENKGKNALRKITRQSKRYTFTILQLADSYSPYAEKHGLSNPFASGAPAFFIRDKTIGVSLQLNGQQVPELFIKMIKVVFCITDKDGYYLRFKNSYECDITIARNAKENSLDHVERNVIIANTAKLIVDEIQSYLQKNKLNDHAKIYGNVNTTDFKKITNQEKFLLYVAKVAVNELLRINEELNDNYLVSIFVDTVPFDNTMHWSCIIAHKDKWNLFNDFEKIHEKDFNDTQKEWLGGDRIRRDARKVNKAKGDVKK